MRILNAYPSKEPQVVETCEIAHVNVVLRTVADLVAVHIEIVFAIDGDVARRLRYDAANHRHGCRLARPIVTQQHCDLIFQNVNRQIVDGEILFAAEFLEHFGETADAHRHIVRILHIDDRIGILIAATRIDFAAAAVAVVRRHEWKIEWFRCAAFAGKYVRQVEIEKNVADGVQQ